MKLRRNSNFSSLNYFSICVVGVIAVIVMHRLGIAQKWDAALMGTLASFWVIIGLFRPLWLRPSFWISVTIWFAVHLLFTWFVFQVLLASFFKVNVFFWAPIATVECLVLYIVVGNSEYKLRRRFNPQRGAKPKSGMRVVP